MYIEQEAGMMYFKLEPHMYVYMINLNLGIENNYIHVDQWEETCIIIQTGNTSVYMVSLGNECILCQKHSHIIYMWYWETLQVSYQPGTCTVMATHVT